MHRPQPAPPPTSHAPQPISQRVEGIASPESSPELSPTDFQVDLETGRRQHRPPLPVQSQQQYTTKSLQRQESSEMDPFLPDLDPEPELEAEPAGVLHGKGDVGYDVNERNPAPGDQHSDDGEDEEGMTTSALFPGSDIF